MKNKIIAIIITFFGLLTIFAGGSVILDLFGMREKEGNYVLFVVWANFISGFLYLIAAYGIWNYTKWSSSILIIAIILLIATFIALLIWIYSGYIYETKTIAAMAFRTLLTIAFLVISKPKKSFNNAKLKN